MIIFKVVDVVGAGRYASARACSFGYGLDYLVGSWTYPKFGRILAFRDYESAKAFRGYGSGLCHEAIFAAEAEDVQDQKRVALWRPEIEAFWTEQVEEMPAPQGSVSCTALMLLAEVEDE